MKGKSNKIFITYAWEDEELKNWAKQLADDLYDEGIETTIDQYDLNPGDRIPQFMEESIKGAVYVLVICTPKYKRKADKRLGGVGYESHLISGEIYAKGNTRKYIPILRRGTINKSLPDFLDSALAVVLSENVDKCTYDKNFHKLTTMLKGGTQRPIALIAGRTIIRNKDIAGKTVHATIGDYFEKEGLFAVTIYDSDLFEARNISKLSVGDTLLVDGMFDTVIEVSTSEDGDIIAALKNDRNIGFSYVDDDYMIAYNADTFRHCTHIVSKLYLPVAKNIIYEDYSDPDREEAIIINNIEEILKIKEEKERISIGFDSYATVVTINKNLEITKIRQYYDVAQ